MAFALQMRKKDDKTSREKHGGFRRNNIYDVTGKRVAVTFHYLRF
jgi:hypothetical protein